MRKGIMIETNFIGCKCDKKEVMMTSDRWDAYTFEDLTHGLSVGEMRYDTDMTGRCINCESDIKLDRFLLVTTEETKPFQKFEVSFYDLFEVNDASEINTAILNYMEDCVRFKDVSGFEIKPIKE